MNKKMLLLILLAFTVMFSGSLFGEAVIYEPFNDPDPELKDNAAGLGFSGTWSSDGFDVAASTLFHGNLPVSGARAVISEQNYGSADVGSTLTDAGLLADGATLWFSVIWKTGYTGGSNPDQAFALSTDSLKGSKNNNVPVNGSGSGVGFTLKGETDIRAAYWSGGNVQRPNDGSINLSKSTVYLIVGEIVWGDPAGDPNDYVNIYLPNEALELGPVISSVAANLNQSGLDTITFSAKSAGGAVDEIRFGATYADVLGDPLMPNIITAGDDTITWFGEPVIPDVNVVDNSGGTESITYNWSFEPVAGLDIDVDTSVSAVTPSFTISKAELLELPIADSAWNDVNDLSAIGDPGAAGILMDSSDPNNSVDPNSIYADLGQQIPAGDYVVTLDYYIPASGGITTGSYIGAGLYDVNELGPWDGSETGVSVQDSGIDMTADAWLSVEIPITTTEASDTLRIDAGPAAASGMVFVKNINVAQAPIITTDDMIPVTFMLGVNYEGNANNDSIDWMILDVYPDACKAARIAANLAPDHPADFYGNCLTDIEDLAVIAGSWLADNSLVDPVQLTTAITFDKLIFSEDFEAPVVSGYSQGTAPGGWVKASVGYKSSNHGLINKDSGVFTASEGNDQGYAFRYTNSGLTTAEGVIGVLEADVTYTISFDVVRDGGSLGAGTAYKVNFMTFDAVQNRADVDNGPQGTNLASKSGTAPEDGSRASDSFEFTADAANAYLGQDIAVRLDGATNNAIIDNVRVIANTSKVNAGDSMLVWLGQEIQLDPNYAEGYTPTSFAWSASPDNGVVFSDPSIEAPTVTFTGETGNPTSVALTLTTDGGADEGVVIFNVYDDGCKAKSGYDDTFVFDQADITLDCIVNLGDFALLAEDWLNDYSLVEPEVK